MYPIVYLDCIVVKIRQDKQVIKKAIYLALAVNTEGHKEVANDLKRVYQSATEDEALREIEQVEEKWRVKYPLITRSWRKNWDNPNTFFGYPPGIRKAIYTTNAIESLNSIIRNAIKKRKLFPHDDAAKRLVYLATREASKRWTRQFITGAQR